MTSAILTPAPTTEPTAARRVRAAPWTSWRSYVAPSGTARSVIANERDHTKVFLEDVSSRLWSAIERGRSYGELCEVARALDCAAELDDFLAELDDLGLLDDGRPHRPTALPERKPLEEAENTSDDLEFQTWAMDAGFLFSVHWELTYRCNERCAHCYNPGAAHTADETPQRTHDELSTDEVIRVFDELVELGTYELTLSGGEILLRKDIEEVVAAARARGFSVHLYTNGQLLDEVRLDRIARLWPASVGVSMYTADAIAHDEITHVPGSFERSRSALERLRAHGIKTSMKATQMRHTLGDWRRTRQLATELGATPELDLTMSAGVDGAQAPLDLAPQDPAELVVLAATEGSPLFVGDAEARAAMETRDPDASVCGAGLSGLSFAADGSIYPCNSLPIGVGSLRDLSVSEVWRASLAQRPRATDDQRAQARPPGADLEARVDGLAQWQGVRLRDYRECGTHARCRWCTKCPGLAMLEHGDALGPSSTNCRTAMARLLAVRLLDAGETAASIAEGLGVDPEFGSGGVGRLPIVRETARGDASHRDPRTTSGSCGGGATSCGTAGTVGYRSPRGEQLLRGGTERIRDALAAFERVRERFPTLNEALE